MKKRKPPYVFKLPSKPTKIHVPKNVYDKRKKKDLSYELKLYEEEILDDDKEGRLS